MVAARSSLALLALVCMATPAQALFDDLTFTAVVTDPADNAGFVDLREVALAETGDEELVVRYQVDRTLPGNANLDQDFFFSFDGTTWSTGIDSAGGQAGNGNFDVPATSSCALDGGYGYCVIPYASIGASVGSVLTGTYAISYAGSAQDYAPGLGGWAPHGVLAPKGSDYTLAGCTRTAGCGGAEVTDDVVEGNLTSARLTLSLNADTNATHVYHFTSGLASPNLVYDVQGTGNVTLAVLDGGNATLYNQTHAAPANGTQALAGASPGNWTYRLDFTGFTGNVTLDLVAPSANGTTSTSGSSTRTSTVTTSQGATGNGTASSSATDTGSSNTPGLAWPVLLLVVAVATLWRRRN